MQSGIYSYPATSRIVYGTDCVLALARELDLVGARRVYVIASGTLERGTDVVRRVRDALGERYARICARIGAHTPRIDVVTAANAARTAGADLLLGVGGSSVTDATKMVAICLGNDITDPAVLDACRISVRVDGTTIRPSFKPPPVASVIIPTTLSAGEFSALADCTDTVRHVKESYYHPQAAPRTVILDPAVTVHTPQWLWLSIGMRAVDHAIEDLCSLYSKPFSDGTPLHALRLVSRGLPAVKENRHDYGLPPGLPPQGMTGTVDMVFAGDPSINLRLMPR